METPQLPIVGPEAWAEQLAASLHAQRDRARELVAAQQTRLERAEAMIEQQIERLEDELGGHRDEANRLRAERDALATRLAQTEVRLAEAEKRRAECPGGAEYGAEGEDGEQRNKSAEDEIRKLKNKNGELQQQLAKARSAAANLARQAQQSGRLDWEAEKRRIVAQLEAGFDADDAAQQAERLTIEEVLRTTDQIVAAKDREIQELKQQLERSASKAAGISNAAAIDEAMNSDPVVREERERLKRLQDQWREKLRQAEVEISLERAKIARERAELAEHLRASNPTPSAPATEVLDHAGRPGQGRWLAQMGLTDADREPGRHG
jgi:hypothetical protein